MQGTIFIALILHSTWNLILNYIHQRKLLQFKGAFGLPCNWFESIQDQLNWSWTLTARCKNFQTWNWFLKWQNKNMQIVDTSRQFTCCKEITSSWHINGDLFQYHVSHETSFLCISLWIISLCVCVSASQN